MGKNEESQEDVKQEEFVIPEDNAPKKNEYKGWIKMTLEEMHEHQNNGNLIGYNPAKGLGLVKLEEIKKK